MELHDEELQNDNYQPPPAKAIEEIAAANREDDGLRPEKIVVDMNDQRKVLVKKLALDVDRHKDIKLDLAGDLNQLKKQVFVYKMRIDFLFPREIVYGLKCVQKTGRLGVAVHKTKHTVGSKKRNSMQCNTE
uniref:Uncharacterized protein n=1 Tax=Glossina pallidipes TaxID=7398 RepID=A0A1B0AGZ4_GLOPL